MEDPEKEKKIMAIRAVFKKGTAKQMKRSVTSPHLAHKLSKAIVQLENDDIDKLERIGKVKKIHELNDRSFYVYRVTPTKRIIFSSIDGTKYIHDVVSATTPPKVHSLLSAKEE